MLRFILKQLLCNFEFWEMRFWTSNRCWWKFWWRIWNNWFLNLRSFNKVNRLIHRFHWREIYLILFDFFIWALIIKLNISFCNVNFLSHFLYQFLNFLFNQMVNSCSSCKSSLRKRRLEQKVSLYNLYFWLSLNLCFSHIWTENCSCFLICFCVSIQKWNQSLLNFLIWVNKGN